MLYDVKFVFHFGGVTPSTEMIVMAKGDSELIRILEEIPHTMAVHKAVGVDITIVLIDTKNDTPIPGLSFG